MQYARSLPRRGILLLAALPLPLAAQDHDATVIGRVLSARDQRPVQATVRVQGTHLQQVANAEGRFVLAHVPPGSRRLWVSAIGYRAYVRDVELAPGDTAHLTVLLEESVFQLQEVVVATGSFGERTLRETLSPTSVVAAASLDRQLDATLSATLRREPGVASGSLSATTAQPVLRGLSGDRVVILQDGLRPGDLASTSLDHAVTIDPLNARSIEVVRGPMSLLYGSSALSGAINLVRDEIPAHRPDGIHGALTAQLSSVNRGAAAGGYFVKGVGPLVVRGEGTLRTAGDTRTPVGPLPNTQTTTLDFATATSYVGHSGHGGISYRFYDNEYGIPGGYVGGHPEGVDVAMQRHTLRASAEVHRESGRWESLEANVGATAYRHTEFEPSGAAGTRFRQSYLTANAKARHRGLFGATRGAIGLDLRLRDIRTGGTLRTPSTSDYGVALYAVQEYGSGPLRFQAGLRYDHSHYEPEEEGVIFVGGQQVPIRPRSFASFSGSTGVLVDVGRHLQVGASVARAYRTPDFIELYSDGPHLADNSYTVGDPSLKAESGLGVDVFARFERSRVRAEVAFFSNLLRDYVFPSSRGRAIIGRQGGRPLFQYTNESARFAGAEGSITINLGRHLLLESTASYVAARFTSDRAPIPVIEPPDTTFVQASRFPPFIPPAFGNVELRYERPSYFAGGGLRWAAAQDRLGDFETRTEGYAVADIHAGARVLAGGRLHTITVRVDNLTDAVYRDHLSRIKEIMPQPGRSLSLLYRMSF
ncbi:MAG TPA: TonB-dependent receptor [Gemmatimonadaceae bacterium]|nr:TonB-dependent receptor [Gemmatimonadaceae bacterium]